MKVTARVKMEVDYKTREKFKKVETKRVIGELKKNIKRIFGKTIDYVLEVKVKEWE